MKLPKQQKRHCPYCNAHNEVVVTLAKRRGRNQTRPLSRGSRNRLKLRGLARGHGNTGRYSKPAVASWKMTGKKVTKKTDFRYRCKKCQKTHVQQSGLRAKKVEIV